MLFFSISTSRSIIWEKLQTFKNTKPCQIHFFPIHLGSWETEPENQDGVGGHTAPPPMTRTDRKSNRKEVRHQVDKK